MGESGTGSAVPTVVGGWGHCIRPEGMKNLSAGNAAILAMTAETNPGPIDVMLYISWLIFMEKSRNYQRISNEGSMQADPLKRP